MAGQSGEMEMRDGWRSSSCGGYVSRSNIPMTEEHARKFYVGRMKNSEDNFSRNVGGASLSVKEIRFLATLAELSMVPSLAQVGSVFSKLAKGEVP